jgi:hypothetical protein
MMMQPGGVALVEGVLYLQDIFHKQKTSCTRHRTPREEHARALAVRGDACGKDILVLTHVG